MIARDHAVLALAAFQAADLLVTQLSANYGDRHLDHLGVPPSLRPALPAVKAAAVLALLATSRRPRPRSLTAAGLVAYYSAAATFHIESGDRWRDVAPAVVGAGMAAWMV